MSFGSSRLSSYPCAYFKSFGDEDFIIILLYVGDMLVLSSNIDQV